jgi:hypothetical protein
MKATKFDGLVRCTVKQTFKAYREGDTVRLSPREAQLYVAGGYVEEAKLPKGVAVEAVPDPEPVPVPILPNPAPGIPEGWEELHQLQQNKLAEQIAKRPVKKEEVAGIIRSEIERRLTE